MEYHYLSDKRRLWRATSHFQPPERPINHLVVETASQTDLTRKVIVLGRLVFY